MYIDDLTDAVVACAEAKGWHVEAGIIYKEQKSEFEFGKYSPAGRDFSFNATMKCANINSLIENIDNYYEGFNVDSETYIWLDQSGHGRNGTPYRMRAVLEDMECIYLVRRSSPFRKPVAYREYRRFPRSDIPLCRISHPFLLSREYSLPCLAYKQVSYP